MRSLRRSRGARQKADVRRVDKHTETRRQPLPDAAAVYCLQGKLWHGHQDLNKAIECYAEALKVNPFMWDAFLGLCDLGKPYYVR